MKRIFLNKNGSMLWHISGDVVSIENNTKEGDLFTDIDWNNDQTDYFDFETETWIPVGKGETPHEIFDYNIKQWIDPRTLDDIKVQQWAKVRSQRDKLEFGGFEFEGNVYDSDQVSQGRIMGAASAGVDQVWTLADNTKVELIASQLQQLYVTLQTHISSVHERGRIARLAIESAETVEEVEAVQL